MAKLSLTNIAAGYALITTLNANNDLIEAALENTLSLDGTTPNAMTAALDMNSKALNNLVDATLQQQPVTLAQLQSAQTASITGVAASVATIADAAANYTSGTVEGALAEIWTELASVANGDGASYIGLEDAAGIFTATDVEAAIAEIFTGAFSTAGIWTFAAATAYPVVVSGGGLKILADSLRMRNEDNDDGNFIEWQNTGNDGAVRLGPAGSRLHITSTTGAFDRVLFGDLNFEMPIFIAESAADVSDITGYGQLFVSNLLTDQQFMFTDENGEKFVAAGVNVFEVSTTTSLAAVAASVNTNVRKVEGFMVFNTTTNKPCWAAGNADADVWVGADGATLHSPIA